MNNLSVDQVDQPFETLRRVFQINQKHMWTKEKLIGHRTLQATPIIPSEMQIGEAQKRTNSLQQNSKRKECQIENVDS
jgi:hypothetical protein